MSDNLEKEKNRNHKQNRQGEQKKQKYFKDRKEFVTWLIGVIIAYAMSIGAIVWGYYDKKAGGEMYDVAFVTGILFIIAITAFVIGPRCVELAAILLAVVMILMGLVLPIMSGFAPVIVVTFLIWFAGILIIIDAIAKLTKTTDRKYYKVIFGAAGKLTDGIYNGITNKKKSKAQKAVEKTGSMISKTIRFVIKAVGMVWVLMLVGVAIFCFYKGAAPAGFMMLACALFFLFCIK